jgi:hypothetical protein
MPRIAALLMLRSTMNTVSAPASRSFRGSLPHPTHALCTLRVQTGASWSNDRCVPRSHGELLKLVIEVAQCAFRKSYPDVMVVQPRQDGDGYNDPGPLD